MNPTSSLPTNHGPANAQAQAKATQLCVSSTEILRGQKAVEIHHNGSTYKLQATRLGKLILTK
jgi:hemin uptake protein HemP